MKLTIQDNVELLGDWDSYPEGSVIPYILLDDE